jgi:hypothetical protein
MATPRHMPMGDTQTLKTLLKETGKVKIKR